MIERCLKFYNSIDHVYKQSPIDEDSLNISIWRLFFCKQENEFNADDDLYNDVITAPSSGDNAEVNSMLLEPCL